MLDDVSIWLTPKEPQLSQFQLIIDTLAQKYNSFPFIPHITLYYCSNKIAKNEVIDSIQKVIVDQKPIMLPVQKINYSDVFTKTLYIQFDVTIKLKNLFQKTKSLFSDRIEYTLNPHLSLIYKNNMSNAHKEREIHSIDIPTQITFDKLMIITKNEGIISKEEDITKWKVAFEKKF